MRYLPFLLLIFLLSSCWAETVDVQECVSLNQRGFWFGLWHGIIAPFTFIISLFNDSIAVYEVNNNGGWYDFGFLLGIGAFTRGGSHGAKTIRKKRRRHDD